MTHHPTAHASGAGAGHPTLAMYLLFGLTGVGLVLPGTLLPFLMRLWGWHDARAGLLFFVFFIGTVMGAFCARGMLGRMLAIATVSILIPNALIATLRGSTVFGAMLVDGFGLGLAMTALTLLRSRQLPGDRSRELSRLNLIWAFGAACAPVLLLHAIEFVGLAWTLRAYAFAILLCGFVVALPLWNEPSPLEAGWASWQRVERLPVVLALCLPLTTGIEAGVGAWLITFTLREPAAHRYIVSAGTALWAGVLLSRLLFSCRQFRLTGMRYTPAIFAGVLVFGLLSLFSRTSAWSTIFGAFCSGFGVGPLYPQLLALLLKSTPAGNTGFVLAGMGSALMPFLIGQVSQASRSLRMGLALPLAGAFLLSGLLLRAGQHAAQRSRTG